MKINTSADEAFPAPSPSLSSFSGHGGSKVKHSPPPVSVIHRAPNSPQNLLSMYI